MWSDISAPPLARWLVTLISFLRTIRFCLMSDQLLNKCEERLISDHKALLINDFQNLLDFDKDEGVCDGWRGAFLLSVQ